MKQRLMVLFVAIFLLTGCIQAVAQDGFLTPGVVYQPEQVMNWLVQNGKYPDLVRRLQNRVPERLFVSDGCSGPCPQEWKEKSLLMACGPHDIGYWLAGSQLDKLHDDARLMLDVADITGDVSWAVIMFNSVHAWGNTPGMPWSWGRVGVMP